MDTKDRLLQTRIRDLSADDQRALETMWESGEWTEGFQTLDQFDSACALGAIADDSEMFGWTLGKLITDW